MNCAVVHPQEPSTLNPGRVVFRIFYGSDGVIDRLNEQQIHGSIDVLPNIPTAGAVIYTVIHALRNWAGHCVYCSVTARLAYM